MTATTTPLDGIGIRPAPQPEADPTTAAPTKTGFAYCSVPDVSGRAFAPDIHAERLELLRVISSKWANGTVLHYYFFDKPTDGENVRLSNGTKQFIPWTTSEAEKNVVRKAFDVWKNVGIGVKFQEVNNRSDAEIRIGFMRGDGAWSYIGRDIIDLKLGSNARTMNFGWDLTQDTREIDTAVHEIGHTLGFPHEHQNPNAGIVWDEEAVYAALGKPPNSWDRQKTFFNIIRKIAPDTVQGSNWDPDSIMHYPFEAGLIKEPTKYHNGLNPAGGLSTRDKTWVTTFYPPINDDTNPQLKPAVSSQLSLKPGEQKNFSLQPTTSRTYEMLTFGTSDTVMALFEDENGKPRFLAGDDDSGEDRNAYLKIKLLSGRKYILRIRMYYTDRADETSVMWW